MAEQYANENINNPLWKPLPKKPEKIRFEIENLPPRFKSLFASIQKIESFIKGIVIVDNSDQDFYDNLVDKLDNCIDFDYFDHALEILEINSEEESYAESAIRDKLKSLEQMQKRKLREIRCE